MTTFLDLPPADQARVGRAVHDILAALEKDWVDQNPDENGEWTPTYRNYLHNIITGKILGAMFADGTSHCR